MTQSDSMKIHLNSGNMQAEISPLGATLVRLSRGDRDQILGIHNLTDRSINNFYAGAIVGDRKSVV